MAYDLHVHSNCSRHVRNTAPSPEMVAKYAKEAGLVGFALTDHDSRAGIIRAQRAAGKLGVDFIPGIEMSFSYNITNDFCVTGEILGYFIDPNFPALTKIESGGEDSRKIRDSGLRKALKIPKEELGERYTRDDLAKRVVERGDADDSADAYNRVLKPAGQSLVEREKTSLGEAANIILAAGGVPIVAHVGMIIRDYWLWPKKAFEREDLKKEGLPPEYNPDRDFENTLLSVFLDLGVKGFEVYPYHLVGKGISGIKDGFFNGYARELNKRYGLIDMVKGSDCHFRSHILTELGCFPTNLGVIEQLRAEHLKITKAL